MFGVVDRLMFRPYAYLRDPGTVHRVYLQSTIRGTQNTNSYTEYTRYLDLARSTMSFSEAAGFATRNLAVGTGDASRERPVAVVNASFFEFFDTRPALGRFFVAAEDQTPRGADVAATGSGSPSSADVTCAARSCRWATSRQRSSASHRKGSPA